jgi:hypothetical protein
LVLEEDEDGFEMERADKSSIAFFTGLSLISSPGKHMKRGLKIPHFFVSTYKFKEEGDVAKRKEEELTESIWTGLRRLALDPDDDRLLLRRRLRGGGFDSGRHGRWWSSRVLERAWLSHSSFFFCCCFAGLFGGLRCYTLPP